MPVYTRSKRPSPSAVAASYSSDCTNVASTTGCCGQLACLDERRLGQVETGDGGAEPSERDGVRADVALQVHDVEPADVAESRQVEAHDVAQERRIVGEARHAVVG